MAELSAALVSGLAALTDALDDPNVDIAESVMRLAATVRGAVPSYLGLSLIIDTHDRQMIFAAMDGITEDADVATSLSMPLVVAAPSGDVTLILYGAVPAGFLDLAADLGWLIGGRHSDFGFDTHLSVPVESISALDEFSVVNQAIGVLIAGGHTVRQAHQVLDALATGACGERHVAAAQLLADLDEPPRSGDE